MIGPRRSGVAVGCGNGVLFGVGSTNIGAVAVGTGVGVGENTEAVGVGTTTFTLSDVRFVSVEFRLDINSIIA